MARLAAIARATGKLPISHLSQRNHMTLPNMNIINTVHAIEIILIHMMHVTVFTHIGIAVNEEDKGDENQLGTNDLQNVFSQLVEAAKDWFELGLALGIKVDILEGIDSNKNSDRARLREMLTHWLRSSPSRTWSDICNGLRSDTVKQINLADKIEEKYKGE